MAPHFSLRVLEICSVLERRISAFDADVSMAFVQLSVSEEGDDDDDDDDDDATDDIFTRVENVRYISNVSNKNLKNRLDTLFFEFDQKSSQFLTLCCVPDPKQNNRYSISSLFVDNTILKFSLSVRVFLYIQLFSNQ